MIKDLLVGLLLCSSAVTANDTIPISAERAACPLGLNWSNRGYCVKYFDPKEQNKQCPPQSRLEKPSVTDELMCTAKGICTDRSMLPDRSGICSKPENTPHSFPFKQKQTI